MKTLVLAAVVLALTGSAHAAEEPTASLGFHQDTQIIPSQDEEICPGTSVLQNDDDSFENGYAWRFLSVVPPDYGAWSEGYDPEFVCGVQFLFTQTGYFLGQSMDVFVWSSDADGNPPPGPDPGNVICYIPDIVPGPIGFWPDITVHNVQVCCSADAEHFVGFWGNWPVRQNGWFIVVDEDGPGTGSPRTKIAPGLGYPTGWNHPNIVPVFDDCKDLGIREHAGLGDCEPTPAERTTWGKIKALY